MGKYKMVRINHTPTVQQTIHTSDNRSEIVAKMLNAAFDVNARGMRVEFRNNGFMVLAAKRPLHFFKLEEPDETL